MRQRLPRSCHLSSRRLIPAVKSMYGAPLAVVLPVLASSSALAQTMSAHDVDMLPAATPNLVERYGDDAPQFGELRLPQGPGPFPVAVVIHGGCWTKGYATLHNTAPLASALTAKGIATWNIEYRQVGDVGGGWPGTFQDWGAAVDHLRQLAKEAPLDLSRVVTIGHSAGATASLWVAARDRLPKSNALATADPLPVQAAVAIDGPLDFAAFAGPDRKVCDKPVVVPLMGGEPREEPERYRAASPYALLPFNVRQYLVSSSVLSGQEASKYRNRAVALGDKVELLNIDHGGHFDIIAPGTPTGDEVEAFILSRALPGPGPIGVDAR